MTPRTTRPAITRRRALAAAGSIGLAGALAACGHRTTDVFGNAIGTATASSGAHSRSGSVVVGSQQYYSNEIIAELYAQAIEHAGYAVKRRFQIGQREIYLPQLASGAIDVMPEYGGNLLQYYSKDSGATDTAGILKALRKALPDGLTVLDAADATDQDSYTVTAATAKAHSLTSIADLQALGAVTIAANSEFSTRPYGPKGLKKDYGVIGTVTPVEDSGGPLTVKALTSGKVDVADIYTADPAIVEKGLVVLEDPKHLVLPENVVPVVADDLAAGAAAAINVVQAVLTTEELRTLNRQSTVEQKDSATIAKAWLTKKGLLA